MQNNKIVVHIFSDLEILNFNMFALCPRHCVKYIESSGSNMLSCAGVYSIVPDVFDLNFSMVSGCEILNSLSFLFLSKVRPRNLNLSPI